MCIRDRSSTTPQQPFAMTTSSDIRGNTAAHTSEVTTSSADSSTMPQPWSNGLITNSRRATIQNSLTTSQTLATAQSRTDGLTTISEEVTSAAGHASTAGDTTTMTDLASTTDDEGTSRTTKSMNQTGHMTTARPQNETETPIPGVHFSESTTVETTTQMIASPSDDDDKFTESGTDEYDVWNNQQELVQVAIISLAVLCIVCVSVCIMMAVLFFVACKRRNLQSRDYYVYKKVPLKDDQQTHNGMQEYSFVEIQPHHATPALSQQDEK